MKEYENLDNFRGRIHTLEMTLQEGEYKGTLRKKISGNCFGQDILYCFDVDYLAEDELFSENNCKFSISEDDNGRFYFSCVLKNDSGEELEVEDLIGELKKLVVKLEIVDCVIENK